MMAQKGFKQKSIMPFSINDLGISPELTEVQALMPIDPKDRENLKKDIEESGEIRDPVKVYVNGNGSYLILCGYNRWRIAQELGWENVPIEVLNLPPADRQELVWKDNLNRRHLTRDQKQRLIDHFLKTDPVQSNRDIAKKTGSDHKTVGERRTKLESGGEIPHLKAVKGRDGKNYSKPAPTKAAAGKHEKTSRNKGISLVNSILASVGDLEPLELRKLALTTTEECLSRLKGNERLKVIGELKKVIKRYQ